MLPRRPAEPDRSSLPTADAGGPAVPRRRGPARGGVSAGHHGVSWGFRRLTRYHGSLRAGREGSRPGREEITSLLATTAGPVTLVLLASVHMAAYPTPAPR